MSIKISRREALSAIACLACGNRSFGDTSGEVKVVCPICNHQYEADQTASETQFGRRLDFRPFGALASPPRVAVCPKCSFVDVRYGEDYPKEELKLLRQYVTSEEYKKLAKSETPYFRLAKMYERLKRPRSLVAYTYLEASWEVENDKDKKRSTVYLTTCLVAIEQVLADDAEKANWHKTAGMLKGELLRRLGKVDDARKHFEAIRKLEAFQSGPYPKMIDRELELIGKKDDQPPRIPR